MVEVMMTMQVGISNSEELKERDTLLPKYQSGSLDRKDAVKLKAFIRERKKYILNREDQYLK